MTLEELAKERLAGKIGTIRTLLTLTPTEMKAMVERQPVEVRALPGMLDPLAAALHELAQQTANASARVKWAVAKHAN